MMDSKQIAELRGLLGRATQGPWEVQNGCSWRRIGAGRGNGNVLCPTNSATDGHPDLTAGRGEDLGANLNLIVALVNAAPALLDAAEKVERYREAMEPFGMSLMSDVANALREAGLGHIALRLEMTAGAKVRAAARTLLTNPHEGESGR